MVKEELVIGLKNAVERGQSLQEAMQSLVAAGYDSNEVKEAAGYINMGVIGKLPPPAPPSQPAIQPFAPAQLTQAQPLAKPIQAMPKKPKRKIKPWLIIIVIAMLVIVGIALTLIFFGESILDHFYK